MSEDAIINLQKAIEQTKLSRAESLSFEEKLRAGADLYDDGIRWIRHILRAENPAASDEQIEAEIERRKRINRQVNEAGFYRPCPADHDHGDV